MIGQLINLTRVIPGSACRDWENPSVSIDGVPDEIRTEHLINPYLVRYCLDNFLQPRHHEFYGRVLWFPQGRNPITRKFTTWRRRLLFNIQRELLIDDLNTHNAQSDTDKCLHTLLTHELWKILFKCTTVQVYLPCYVQSHNSYTLYDLNPSHKIW
jgi:hypothetical protein